ncbi:MAG TPA: hypothetical protein VNJ28_06935, partial [Candidatus Limnocylindrales bacterium]|nr:hypothetical protein [Candidatus Limnocylindrales bacterium]
FVDSFRRLHPTDPGFTLPPLRPRVRLDYLLVSTDLAERVRACRPAPPGALLARASDHLPLVAEID